MGDKCSVWWRDVDSLDGGFWDGWVESVSDKSIDFPGSQWEQILVKYVEDDVGPLWHSPWDLVDIKDREWEQPGIDHDVRKKMISLLSKLEQSARGNQDKFGIMKLKETSEQLDFINRFPVPLTLEIIKLRIKNFYYRSFGAMKHDMKVLLSNARTYFVENTEMSAKIARLSGWFKNQANLIMCDSSMVKGSGTKSNGQLAKTNWLLSSDLKGACRYIPQLGDEVAYFRQGHQEYILSRGSLERGPWDIYKGNIRDVEMCSVDELDYAILAGSRESACKLKLRFIDPLSNVLGQTFKLTLPEFVHFPDFLVERMHYENSLEKNWIPGDKCLVWWHCEDDDTGAFWDGWVDLISDKSVDFPGSQWERILVKYEDDDVGPLRHCPWELVDNTDRAWEQPGINRDVRKMMVSLLRELEHSAWGNKDMFGIVKLKQTSERLDYVKRFPAPLTLEIVELRIKNSYYRSTKAMKHDITVMLSNARTYFARHAEM